LLLSKASSSILNFGEVYRVDSYFSRRQWGQRIAEIEDAGALVLHARVVRTLAQPILGVSIGIFGPSMNGEMEETESSSAHSKVVASRKLLVISEEIFH